MLKKLSAIVSVLTLIFSQVSFVAMTLAASTDVAALTKVVAPTAVAAENVIGNKVKVSWTVSGNEAANSVDGYRVCYKLHGGAMGICDNNAVVFTSTTPHNQLEISGLAMGTYYDFLVKTIAKNATESTATCASCAVNNFLAQSLDSVPPVLSNIHLASNNADTTKAKIGDVLTLSFTSDENLGAGLSVKINNKNATVVTSAAPNYTATLTVAEGDDAASAAVLIANIADVYGNTLADKTATTDASAVEIDAVKPVITITDNAAGVLKISDTIVANFTDAHAGVAANKWVLNATATCPTAEVNYVNDYTGDILIDTDYVGYVCFFAKDNFGNTKTLVSGQVKVSTIDTDNDGIPNGADDDIDGDGILNIDDYDVDGDDVLNNADTDVDGDGLLNGVDDDADGDGILNAVDATPYGKVQAPAVEDTGTGGVASKTILTSQTPTTTVVTPPAAEIVTTPVVTTPVVTTPVVTTPVVETPAVTTPADDSAADTASNNTIDTPAAITEELTETPAENATEDETVETISEIVNDAGDVVAEIPSVSIVEASDDSGVPLYWQNRYFPNGGFDPSADSDNDGLSNKIEYILGTDPTNEDSDYDHLNDGEEVKITTDPTRVDTDGDGLSDYAEVGFGTNPKKVDTDGDGDSDATEITNGTDPLDPNSFATDTDGDGVNDDWEIKYFGDISFNDYGERDYDLDGLSDKCEYKRGTDPTNADTDGDGFTDGAEVLDYNTDPLNKNSKLKENFVSINNWENGEETGDRLLFFKGLAPKNSDVEIYAISGNSKMLLALTVADSEGKFSVLSDMELSDGEYFMTAIAKVNGEILAESKTLKIIVNGELAADAPAAPTIEDFAGILLDGQSVNSDGVIQITNTEPTVGGYTEQGAQVFAVWHSVITSSSVIVDSELGRFDMKSGGQLEVGKHELILYAEKNGLKSAPVKVQFEVIGNNVQASILDYIKDMSGLTAGLLAGFFLLAAVGWGIIHRRHRLNNQFPNIKF